MAANKEVPYADFGKRLTRLRKEAGMTQAQLGEKCGVASSTIVNYERGTRIPYADTAVKMADCFHMSVEELLGVESPDVEMKKAQAVDEMGRIFGSSAAKSAQTYIDGSNALLAGGTLSKEDQLDFIDVMRKVLADAEVRAREKYTPHKFRSPEWEDSMEEKREQANEVIKDADNNLKHKDD